MRQPLIAGNWKMNTTMAEAVALASAIGKETAGMTGVEIAVFPPYTWLGIVAAALADSQVALGAQDSAMALQGAYTGEVSSLMLAEWCKYVILGHSERRDLLGESSELVNLKIGAAFTGGLVPVLCVGENAKTRQAGRAVEFVLDQLDCSLAGIDSDKLAGIVVAYEPVWAIGAGVAATPDDAQQMCQIIRDWFASRDQALGSLVRVLYGGSVTASNAPGLLAQPDVDGALVGGASLKADSFAAICSAAC